MSTVRLVSVVVPDWLMATTRASAMLRVRIVFVQDETAEFGSLEGIDLDRGIIEVVAQYIGAGQGRHTGRPLAHEVDPADAPSSRAWRRWSGMTRFVQDNRQPVAVFGTDFPAVAQGPFNRSRGFGDLFEKIVGIFLAVDVARGELRGLDVFGRQDQRRAVVIAWPECRPVRRRRPGPERRSGPAPGRPGRDHLFTVHFEVALGLFDKAVDFRGRHVGVFGQADENGLAAAPLGQKEFARCQGGVHRDGVGAFEILDGQAKSLGHVVAGLAILG
jgi:hypothetical protein